MVKAQNSQDGPAAPLWVRRPEVLHRVAYAVAALVFTGQIVAAAVRGRTGRRPSPCSSPAAA